MAFLYLIRHPLTAPDPAVPASLWRLSEEGYAQVQMVIAAPFWHTVTAVYTSDQHKAAVIGEAAAAKFGLPHHVIPDLTEAARDGWVDPAEFQAAQARFFADPHTVPLPGWESADSARARFVGAMEDLLAAHPAEDSLAVAAHATVLSLYVAFLRAIPATFEDWRSIGFATVCAVDRATMQPLTDFLAAPYAGLPGNE